MTMVATATIRLLGWGGAFVFSAGAFGLAWATQTLEVPLWAVLVLTFVPTSDLIEVIQSVVDAAAEKAGAEKR